MTEKLKMPHQRLIKGGRHFDYTESSYSLKTCYDGKLKQKKDSDNIRCGIEELNSSLINVKIIL